MNKTYTKANDFVSLQSLLSSGRILNCFVFLCVSEVGLQSTMKEMNVFR